MAVTFDTTNFFQAFVASLENREGLDFMDVNVMYQLGLNKPRKIYCTFKKSGLKMFIGNILYFFASFFSILRKKANII